MLSFTDSTYLLQEQYRDASRLRARIALHERFGTNPLGWNRWLFDQLAIDSAARILEVGCGSGSFWQQNVDRVPARLDVTLSDFSPGMVDAARGAVDSPSVRYAVIDTQALPYRDGAFDAVLANHMLYHVPDRDRAIAEVRRVLRPGGTFYAATNGRGHLRELMPLIAPLTNGEAVFGIGDAFGLETGLPVLRRHFANVEMRRFDESLEVTEVEPLIDYARSILEGPVDPGALDGLRLQVEGAIAARGPFHITKVAGLFIATP